MRKPARNRTLGEQAQVLRAVPDDARTRGSGRVGLGSEFGVCMDVASVSGLLLQLIFRVWDLVMGGVHIVRSDGKKSGEARGLQVQEEQFHGDVI